MNKTAIKNFAVWARNKLIADITYKAGLIGVSEKGIAQPLPQSSKDLQFFDIGTKDYAQVAGSDIAQRNALVRAVQEKERTSDYKTAFKAVIEEVAYTWFNRLIAIRFMEVNEYLPSRIRVLSSENPAKNEPDFVTTPFDTDMEFTMAEQDRIMQLKDENKLDDLFRMLFVKQCNKLHEILPELFEETNNYTEMLLSISFTDKDGIVYHLVHDIAEDDFNVEKEGQVEIIGWMYQFYNIEPKANVFSKPKGTKILKEEVPAATQLFTPDWIVRYMVENSLGRIWVEGHPSDNLKENWNYYLEEAEQEASVQVQLEQIRAEYRNLNPEDIKVIDPCVGSGHILVYCFDVLMQIYESKGYTQRDAAQSILEKNLFGLDIDKRAAQLAYFAVMMKARQYDRRILTRGIFSHVLAIEESNMLNRQHIKYFGTHLSPTEQSKAKKELSMLVATFEDAKDYGSILNIQPLDWELLERCISDCDISGQMTFDSIGIDDTQCLLKKLVKQGQIMDCQYEVVCTNPPYMAVSSGSANLNKYVKDNYTDSKTDLFAVFIEKCRDMTKKNGYQAMITMHSWMFLSSYEKLREKILLTDTINMAHLGARAFEEIAGEVVQTTSFVQRKSSISNYAGTYCRLIAATSQDRKERMFLAGENRYISKNSNFKRVPGSIFAYWASEALLGDFAVGEVLKKKGDTRQGMATSDNNRFLRLWFEVAYEKIGFGCKNTEEALEAHKKWYPYNKGGEYRKWYGNSDYIVNYENDGFEVKDYAASLYKTPSRTIKSMSEYFKPCISWSKISTGSIAFRYYPEGYVFDVAGCCIFYKDFSTMLYDFGFVNSAVAKSILNIISPTLNYEAGHIASLPVIRKQEYMDAVITLVNENIALAKSDWDSFESSWDFKEHPLVTVAKSAFPSQVIPSLEGCFERWAKICEARFANVKKNEEELNRIFIEIYGLQNELQPELEDKDITVSKADLAREIRSLISYAIGCMFGRYSVDFKGIAFAGGVWEDNRYLTFLPDKDNCIPITDEAYFEDDMVGLFCKWVETVFGSKNLDKNLDFIANALDCKGVTAREIIRSYFLNDFYKDHCASCSVSGSGKRPIYWLFDSGKQNGFKAFVYMHRWDADTVGNLRVEYLHRMQHTYEREIVRMQETIDNSRDSRDVSKATKRKDKLQKQLKETKDYDAMLAHIALSRIDIDLDDGFKTNYEKVQTDRDGKKMPILAKI